MPKSTSWTDVIGEAEGQKRVAVVRISRLDGVIRTAKRKMAAGETFPTAKTTNNGINGQTGG